MKKILIALISTGLLTLSSSIFADILSKSKVHFNSIASGDISKLMGQYHKESRLDWIGGPLDGSYSGKGELRAVWGKFTKALGPMQTQVSNISENSNPKGSTITADILFIGKKTIPVHYTLLYRDKHIVNEIWQISPALDKK